MAECGHERLKPEVMDQTLGVVCMDCGAALHWCWAERCLPESAWNRACLNDPDARPTEQSRDDHCAICGDAIGAPS